MDPLHAEEQDGQGALAVAGVLMSLDLPPPVALANETAPPLLAVIAEVPGPRQAQP